MAHCAGPGGGLRASTLLGLGGLAWLAASFALVLWLDGRDGADGLLEIPQPASVFFSALPAQPAPDGDLYRAALEVDALVETILPLALPLARWQREWSDPSIIGADSRAEAEAQRRYVITGPCAPLRLGLALLEKLGARPGAAALPVEWPPHRIVWTEEGDLEIRLAGRVSHVFRFPGREAALADLARPLPRPALVLVLDDLGQKLEPAEALAALPFPVTFAVWPHAPKARETAALAGQQGLDCLVHLPMEALPKAGGLSPRPGKGALWIEMEPRAFASVLEADLNALPTAVGLNNHMGSAFTGSAAACGRLCAFLSGRGLFVLDSVTRPSSQLARQARAAGLVSASRSVFLDTRRETAAVLAALDKAAARARVQGYAVGIGHPYAETLRALRRWQDKAGVAVVPARRLIWHLALENAQARLAGNL